MTNQFLVVADEDNILRPQAGIWRYDEGGKIASEHYKKKNPDAILVLCELIEVKTKAI